MFDSTDYSFMHSVVFRPDYPGYRPKVIEAPNRDGMLDTNKRFSHIAVKYLAQFGDVVMFRALLGYLKAAHARSLEVFDELDLPERYRPCLDYSCLRILEYPPGAGAAPHTDFDLFTLSCYRDQPEKFKYVGPEPSVHLQQINPGLHLGDMLMATGYKGALRPNAHYVEPSDTTQRSIVFFAVPSWQAPLASGETVGEWIQHETAKARVYE